MKIPPKLKALSACDEAMEWLESLNVSSHQSAWKQCDRGDWMLWLIGKLSGPSESEDRKQLVRAACGCARLALKFVKEGEHRPRICIETAEAWADGKATIEQVRKARSAYAASSDVASYAAYAAASSAAYAASYAAASSDAASYASYAASYAAAPSAAYAASYAAASSDAYAARNKILKNCADVVREVYPKVPKL